MAQSINIVHEMINKVGFEFNETDAKRVSDLAEKAAELAAKKMTKELGTVVKEIGEIFNKALGKNTIDFSDLIKAPDNNAIKTLTERFVSQLQIGISKGVGKGGGLTEALRGITDPDEIEQIEKEFGSLEEKLERLKDLADEYGVKITQRNRDRHEELNQKEMDSGLTSKEEERMSELYDLITQADEALVNFEQTYNRVILKLANGKKVEILPDDKGLGKFAKFADGWGEEYDGIEIEDIVFERVAKEATVAETAIDNVVEAVQAAKRELAASSTTLGVLDGENEYGPTINTIKEKQKTLKGYLNELTAVVKKEKENGELTEEEIARKRELTGLINRLDLAVRYQDGSYFQTGEFGEIGIAEDHYSDLDADEFLAQLEQLNKIVNLRKKIALGYYDTGTYGTYEDTFNGDKVKNLVTSAIWARDDVDAEQFNASMIGQLTREYQYLHEQMLKCMLVGEEVPEDVIDRMKWFENISTEELSDALPRLTELQQKIDEIRHKDDGSIFSWRYNADDKYYDDKIQDLQTLLALQEEYVKLGGPTDSVTGIGLSLSNPEEFIDDLKKYKQGAKDAIRLKEQFADIDLDKHSTTKSQLEWLSQGDISYDSAVKNINQWIEGQRELKEKLISKLKGFGAESDDIGELQSNLKEREKIYLQLQHEQLLTEDIQKNYDAVNKEITEKIALLGKAAQAEKGSVGGFGKSTSSDTTQPTDTTAEVQNLENVRKKVEDIKTEVKAKTSAFTAEEAEVKRVAEAEIKALKPLEQKVKEIQAAIKGLDEQMPTDAPTESVDTPLAPPETLKEKLELISEDEITKLTQLRDRVKEITGEIKSTINNVVTDETSLQKSIRNITAQIHSAIVAERGQLGKLNSDIEKVSTNIKGLFENIASGETNIAAGLSNINVTVNHPETQQNDLESSLKAIADGLEDIDNDEEQHEKDSDKKGAKENTLKSIQRSVKRIRRSISASNNDKTADVKPDVLPATQSHVPTTKSDYIGSTYFPLKLETQSKALEKFRVQIEAAGRMSEGVAEQINALQRDLKFIRSGPELSEWGQRFQSLKLDVNTDMAFEKSVWKAPNDELYQGLVNLQNKIYDLELKRVSAKDDSDSIVTIDKQLGQFKGLAEAQKKLLLYIDEYHEKRLANMAEEHKAKMELAKAQRRDKEKGKLEDDYAELGKRKARLDAAKGTTKESEKQAEYNVQELLVKTKTQELGITKELKRAELDRLQAIASNAENTEKLILDGKKESAKAEAQVKAKAETEAKVKLEAEAKAERRNKIFNKLKQAKENLGEYEARYAKNGSVRAKEASSTEAEYIKSLQEQFSVNTEFGKLTDAELDELSNAYQSSYEFISQIIDAGKDAQDKVEEINKRAKKIGELEGQLDHLRGVLSDEAYNKDDKVKSIQENLEKLKIELDNEIKRFATKTEASTEIPTDLAREQQDYADALTRNASRVITESQEKEKEKQDKAHKARVEQLTKLYKELGKAEADAAFGADRTEKIADLNKEIDELKKLETSQTLASLSLENVQSTSKTNQSYALLKKEYENLGKLMAQQDVEGTAILKSKIDAQDQIIKKKLAELNITEEVNQAELKGFKDAQKAAQEAEAIRLAPVKMKNQMKKERQEARTSKMTSTYNKGDDVLGSLWRMEDIGVDALASIKEVEQLTNALNQLKNVQDKVEKSIRTSGEYNPAAEFSKDDAGNITTFDKAVKGAIGDVNKYSEAIKELIKNYEFFSDDNSTDLGRKLSPGEDIKTQLIEAAQALHGGKIKVQKYDAATQQLTYTVKSGEYEFTNYTAGVRDVDKALRTVQGTTKKTETLFELLGRKTKDVLTYFSGSTIIYKGIEELRKGIQYVREIDTALTELKKVTDETEASYDRFLETASKTADKVGSTIAEVVSSTADWAKLGYSLSEASKLAETTAIMLNVSEFGSVEEATSALVSTMQAFKYTADQSSYVVDVMNEIGNNYAVSSDGIATALQESASALASANNDYQQSVAMIAAANKTTQDVSKVGGALRTIALRLRGTEVEGEDNEGLITSQSKLREKIKSLSGVDILTDTGAYKSTYEILLEISRVFEKMNDMDQAECCLYV